MSSVSLKIRHAKRSSDSNLSLSHEELTEIPKEISTLSELATLDISNNKLTILDGLQELSMLTSIDASCNNIMTISKSILLCTNLKYLSLKSNPILLSFPNLATLKNDEVMAQLNKYFEALEDEERYADEEEDKEETSKSNHEEAFTKQILAQSCKTKFKEIGKTESLEFNKSQSNFSQKRVQVDESSANVEMYIKKIKDLELAINKLKSEQQKNTALAKIEINSGNLSAIGGVVEIPFDELDIKDQIGGGGFSTIHVGNWRGSKVAIKKIFDPNITKELMDEIYNEVLIMSILRHPKVCLLLGVCSQKANIAIVLEFARTSLYNLLHNSNVTLAPIQKLKIMKDIANAYIFIHKSGIVHRDLKTHNILLTEGLEIKVCDFGLAKYKCDLNKGASQFSGTPSYLSPEVFQKKPYDEKVDTFAYGALVWELYSKEIPYDGLEPKQILEHILAEDLPHKHNIPKQIMEIIRQCRKINPEERPSFEAIEQMIDKLQIEKVK